MTPMPACSSRCRAFSNRTRQESVIRVVRRSRCFLLHEDVVEARKQQQRRRRQLGDRAGLLQPIGFLRQCASQLWHFGDCLSTVRAAKSNEDPMPEDSKLEAPPRIDLKDAIRRAKTQVADLLEHEAYDGLALEEVKYDD